eukprot:m.190644 g.190644  ORF g.190644 m.190644 type:complete len:1320 (+) comp16948_c0_seq1:1-3960(+)
MMAEKGVTTSSATYSFVCAWLVLAAHGQQCPDEILPSSIDCSLNPDNSSLFRREDYVYCRQQVDVRPGSKLCPAFDMNRAKCTLDGALLVCNACDVDGYNISRIPSGLPRTITDVTIRCHYISFVDITQVAQLVYVERLDLSNNFITAFDESLLTMLPNLRHLNLSGNLITNIAVLPNRAALEVLDLTGNPIQRINARVLSSAMSSDCLKDVRVYTSPDSPCGCFIVPSTSQSTCNTIACNCTYGNNDNAMVDCSLGTKCGSQLVPVAALCDGVRDCDNGWDEATCQMRDVPITDDTLKLCMGETLSASMHRGVITATPTSPETVVCLAKVYGGISFNAYFDPLIQAWTTPPPSSNATLAFDAHLRLGSAQQLNLFANYTITSSSNSSSNLSSSCTATVDIPWDPALRCNQTTIRATQAARQPVALIAGLVTAIFVVLLIGSLVWKRRSANTYSLDQQMLKMASDAATRSFAEKYSKANDHLQLLGVSIDSLNLHNITLKHLKVFQPSNELSADTRWTLPTREISLVKVSGWDDTAATMEATALPAGQYDEDDPSLQQLLVEARLLLSLKEHPHIIQVQGVTTMNQSVLMLLSYAPLGCLQYSLSASEYSPTDKVEVCAKLASACCFMESYGIVHRNLGAHNVLVCNTLTDVKLSGFNQARDIYLSENYVTTMQRSDDALPGLDGMARRFWAPEVALDQTFSNKSDVYAFGMLCWQVYSRGAVPLAHLEGPPVVNAIKQGQRPSMPTDMEYYYSSLVQSALSQSPSKRPNFGTLLAALEETPDETTAELGAEWEDVDINVRQLSFLREIEKTSGLSISLYAWRRSKESLALSVECFKLMDQSKDGWQQADIRSRLAHTHIQRFIGTAQTPQGLLFVHEFLPDGLSQRLLQATELPIALNYCVQALRGLEYLTARNVFIADFSINHVAVDRTNTVKLRRFPAQIAATNRDETTVVKRAGDFLSDAMLKVESLNTLKLKQLVVVMQRGRVKRMSDVLLALTDMDASQKLSVPFSSLEFVKVLGHGAFGQVWLMTMQDTLDTSKRTNVAVKLLYDGSLLKDYKQELSMMTKLSHPNLIRLQHTSITPNGNPAMILEFMRYGALDEWLAARGLEVSDEDLLYMAHQVSQGMAELARLGIVHRDLAARNVLVGRSLNCKIADYGLSRTMAISGHSNSAYYKMTSSKPLPVRWMAPSSILDHKYDSSTDVWSFGCLCIEIWTAGEMPFGAMDDQSVVTLLINAATGQKQSGQPLLAPPERCPPRLGALIQQCLTINKELRPSFATIVQRTMPSHWKVLLDRQAPPRHLSLNQSVAAANDQAESSL